MITFRFIAAFFIIYAIAGWCLEVVYATTVTGKFVNRGFLNGPLCPIYGLGAIVVYVSLNPFSENLLILYGCSVILTSVLEFITGLVLEKIFHQKWWDYSKRPFNLMGYVCLQFSLLWGVACVIVVKIVQPAVFTVVSFIDSLGPHALNVLLCIAYGILIADIAVTVIALLNISIRLRLIADMDKYIRSVSDSVGSKLSDETLKTMNETQKLKSRYDRLIEKLKTRYGENYTEYMGKLTRVQKRIQNAFPNLDFSGIAKISDKMDTILNYMEKQKDAIGKKMEDTKDQLVKNVKQVLDGIEDAIIPQIDIVIADDGNGENHGSDTTGDTENSGAKN